MVPRCYYQQRGSTTNQAAAAPHLGPFSRAQHVRHATARIDVVMSGRRETFLYIFSRTLFSLSHSRMYMPLEQDMIVRVAFHRAS
jgi:hypothetical protein